MYENNTSFPMGSYDTDLSWMFDSAHLSTDTSTGYLFSYSSTFTPGDDVGSDVVNALDFQVPRDSLGMTEHGSLSSGEASDRVEEVNGGWPDGLSRPVSPHRLEQRKLRLSSNAWKSTKDEMDHQEALSDTALHSQLIDENTRMAILSILDLSRCAWAADGGLSDEIFPPTKVLTYFLQLYFRHMHPQFPVIHLPTWKPDCESPYLLLGMVLAGSNYSKAARGKLTTFFHEPVRAAFMNEYMHGRGGFVSIHPSINSN